MRHVPDSGDVRRMIERAISEERARWLVALDEVALTVAGPAQAVIIALGHAIRSHLNPARGEHE